MTGAPKVLVFLDVDEWRWRCETCGERSQAFTREFVAALDAGNHVSAAHSRSPIAKLADDV